MADELHGSTNVATEGSTPALLTTMGVDTPLAHDRALGVETAHPFHVAKGDKNYEGACSYWSYIHPEELISLQTGREGKGLNHHDEHLFIIVHQVFELYFRQIIFELESVIDTLLDDTTKDYFCMNQASRRLDRATTVLEVALGGFTVMETMDPVDFLAFREYLSPASGFQSAQMRELEIMVGIKTEMRKACNLDGYKEAFVTKTDDKTPIFDYREARPTLFDAVQAWLDVLVIPNLDAFIERFIEVKKTQFDIRVDELNTRLEAIKALDTVAIDNEAQRQVLAQLSTRERAGIEAEMEAINAEVDNMRSYFGHEETGRSRSAALFLLTFRHHERWARHADILCSTIDFEKTFVMWRQRHARMVERMIGRRQGTGGSDGMEYLDATSSYRVFKDLWHLRAIAIPRSQFDEALANE